MNTIQRSAIFTILVFSLTNLDAQQPCRVVGYYPTWGSSNLPVSSIKFNELTHINYAFGEPNADGSLTGIVDTALIGNAHRAGCRVLLSLGGSNSEGYFSPMAADTTSRTTFVNNLLAYILVYHYDGADFDWESDNPITSADSADELAMMKQTHNCSRCSIFRRGI